MSHPQWYKDAIIYELHVKAFMDSNRDGYGDFDGLTQKLDYLESLGITCVWLLPFFPSPLRDDGYDISDYRNINPRYGTFAAFDRFVAAAHARKIRVLIELVINHTSDQHPWFERARHAPPGSPERNFYVWSDDPSRYAGVRNIFPDAETACWTWDPVAKAYFWHRFYHHQPDLNFDSPEVRAEVTDTMRFWLDRGVDGLRLDAISYLYEREGTACENLPETHAFLKSLRQVMDTHYQDRIFLAEVNHWPADVRAFFGDDDECHMAFHFPLMPRMFMALRQESRRPIVDIIDRTPAIPDACQWGLFLRNHDELTLEMVTDEERDYMVREYAADPAMRINDGIRRRLSPLMNANRRAIELLNGLLLSLPGTPVLYYGDEIGMGDNVYLGDRNGVRTPMQWTGDRNAGFSQADPAALYSPLISDALYNYQGNNVEAQERTPSSLLAWMKRLIHLRRSTQAFGRGTFAWTLPFNARIVGYVREYQGEMLWVVANLSRFAQAAQFDMGAYSGHTPVEMFGKEPFPMLERQPYSLTFGPHGFYWFRLLPG